MEPRTGAAGRRCPNCNALVSADASWCGQCYASLEGVPASGPEVPAAAPAPAVAPPAAAGPAAGEGPSPAAPGGWPCPVCGSTNAIELDACATCGTPFGSVLGMDPTPRRATSPTDALTWSLLYPGLGHRRIGLPLDGLARGVLFTMTFGMAILLALGGVRAGPAVGFLIIYVVLALGIYAGSAFEAFRVAEGGRLFVPSRPLLWVTVGLMLVSVVGLALTVGSLPTR